MKLGDIVRSANVRPKETAIVSQIDISRRLDINTGHMETRTKYEATFPDNAVMHFYGASIGKSVTKVEKDDGQISLFDYCKEVANGTLQSKSREKQL